MKFRLTHILLLILFSIAFLPSATCQEDTANSSENTEKVYQYVEKMPAYVDGDVELLKTVMAAIKYPPQALDQGIQGKAYIKFVVDVDGTLRDYEVLQGVSLECNVEAIRAIHLTSGDWIPGEENGQKVPVYMTLPVNFLIKRLSSLNGK